MFLILFIITLAILIYSILTRTFTKWLRREVPQPSVWFICKGLFKSIVGRKPFAEQSDNLYKCFPNRRYMGVYQLHIPMLLVLDPDLIKQITVKDFDHFVDHNQVAIDDPLWQKSLLSLKGDKWRKMRATLSPSFTSSKMKMMFGLMCECAEQFVEHFLQKDENIITLEMKDTLSKYTNDVIASVAFGVKCDSLKEPNNEFYIRGKGAMNFAGIRFLMLFLMPRIANVFGMKVFQPKVSSFFRKLIKDTLEYREKEGIVRMDMIHLLMQARKGKFKDESLNIELSEEEIENYRHLSDEDITAQALIFFLAGFESISSEMSFAAYELALHPDVQKRLQAEIDDTLVGLNSSLTYTALMEMKYLDMVVSETLRKWPTLVATDRVCVKPYVIEPLTPGEKPIHLKKGDIVNIPIYAMQRDSKYYPSPDRFDPERFSDDNKDSINPYTYLTFGIGPRNCIGNRFALLEMKTILVYILSKFDIVVVDKTEIPLTMSDNPVNLSAKKGFWLGLKPRAFE